MADKWIADLYVCGWQEEKDRLGSYMDFDEFTKRAKITYVREIKGDPNDWRIIVLVPGQDRLWPFVTATPELRARLYGSKTKDYSNHEPADTDDAIGRNKVKTLRSRA